MKDCLRNKGCCKMISMKGKRRAVAGFVTMPELIFLLTIGVIGMVVGYSVLQGSLNEEYADLAASVGAANQSWQGIGVDGNGQVSTDAGAWDDLFDLWDRGQDPLLPIFPKVILFQTSALTQEQSPIP